VKDQQAKDKLLKQFQEAEIMSKPIGFYTWNATLAACFRFMRFFQQELDEEEIAVPRALAQTLAKDKAMLADYQKVIAFYSKLTNPMICLSLVDLTGPETEALAELARKKGVSHATVAVFPPSRSRETIL